MIPKRRIGDKSLEIVPRARLAVDLDFDKAVQRTSEWAVGRIGERC